MHQCAERLWLLGHWLTHKPSKRVTLPYVCVIHLQLSHPHTDCSQSQDIKTCIIHSAYLGKLLVLSLSLQVIYEHSCSTCFLFSTELHCSVVLLLLGVGAGHLSHLVTHKFTPQQPCSQQQWGSDRENNKLNKPDTWTRENRKTLIWKEWPCLTHHVVYLNSKKCSYWTDLCWSHSGFITYCLRMISLSL